MSDKTTTLRSGTTHRSGTYFTPTAPKPIASYQDRSNPVIYDQFLKTSFQTAATALPALTWWQWAAAWPTRRALTGLATQAGDLGQLWRQRAQAYDLHVAALSPWQALTWAGKQLLDEISLPQKYISRIILPGPHFASSSMSPRCVARDGLLRRPQCLITKDHAVLEGLSFEHVSAPKVAGPVVVVPGNSMRIQVATRWWSEAWLESLARTTSRDVFMFNYRRFGDSLGSTCTTNAAILDVRAAISRAWASDDGPCCVVGLSIGGGCGAAAIDALYAGGELQFGNIDLLAIVHSFRSIPAAASGQFGRPVAPLVRWLLALSQLNPLNTQAIIQKTELAPVLISLRAKIDHLISPSAVLTLANIEGLVSMGHRTRLAIDVTSGETHCDLSDAAALINRAGRADLSMKRSDIVANFLSNTCKNP